MRKILVIGCGGYVGSHFLDSVLAYPEVDVIGIDPIDSKISGHLDRPNFRLIRSYLHNPEVEAELKDALSWCDVVINLAAICNPAEYNTQPLSVIRSNFIDGYPLVDMCSDAGKWLIHYSTSETYGRTIRSYLGDNGADDEDLYLLEEDKTPLIMGPIVNQRWSYASAKQLMERYILAHHFEKGLPFSVVRPLNFFGPRMDYIPGRDGEGVPRVLACFMTALMDRQPMLLVDGGMAQRTIVSIHDATRALLLMLHNRDNAIGQAFNIGNPNSEVTMGELAEHMRRLYAEITGDQSYLEHPIESISSEVFYGAGYEDCDRRMPSIAKAEQRLGWRPEINLEDTLRETMRYYHAHYVEGVSTGASSGVAAE